MHIFVMVGALVVVYVMVTALLSFWLDDNSYDGIRPNPAPLPDEQGEALSAESLEAFYSD